MRTFIALCLSVGTTRRIAEAMEREQGRLAGLGWKLAWVPPANLHVTVKFVGDVPPESIDAISAAVRRRAAVLPPMTLKVKGYGVFPAPIPATATATAAAPAAAPEAPRVLWVHVDGGAPLSAFKTSLEGDLFELGFPRDLVTYRSHVTVARVTEAPASFDIGKVWSSDVDFGEDRIAEAVVYESQLHRAGAEYVARARVPFSKLGK
jgi:2'-5' RNA ligase